MSIITSIFQLEITAMATTAKFLLPILHPILPYIPSLPTPLLTLPANLALHYTTSPSPNIFNYILSPLTHPLHLPLLLTLVNIPIVYALGWISGNISWVDRLWPFYTPFCSGLILLWGVLNPSAGVLSHNLPRVGLMFALQIVWSIRLTSHAIRRGFYDLTGQDYRYTAFKKISPWWLFQLVHLFAVAIGQTTLLFALCLPVHAALTLPPSELSSGPIPHLSIPHSLLANTSTPSTPVLNLTDLFLTFLSLTCIYTEYISDNQMYQFQTLKHSPSPNTPLILPSPIQKTIFNAKNVPQPAGYPRDAHPGFKTGGLWKWSRHPNFAAEQIFWVVQACFVVGGARSSAVTKAGWMGGGVWGPCFALSILFCGSTALTEWITERKYPKYKQYRGLVGQFLPQETALIWLWSKITGTREKLHREVYIAPRKTQ